MHFIGNILWSKLLLIKDYYHFKETDFKQYKALFQYSNYIAWSVPWNIHEYDNQILNLYQVNESVNIDEYECK